MFSFIRKSPVSVALFFSVFCAPAIAGDWFPLPITSTDDQGVVENRDYVALSRAEKPWKICVSLPHMKDSFFLAADYGLSEEAKRLGVQLQVMDAGGYNQLSTQISQIENCVAGGAQAVVIAAISQDGLTNLLSQIKKKNIVVIDAYNGISSPDVTARVLTIPREEGARTGRYLAEKFPGGGKPVNIVWLPGPAGAGFVEMFNEGFREAIKDSAINLLDTQYGETTKERQSQLVENAMQAHPNLDYIVGTAITAEAAVPLVRAHNLKEKIKIVSVYTTPGVYQLLKTNAIEAAGEAPVVLVGRIALDQAVRALEGKPFLKNVGPVGKVYVSENIHELQLDTVLAPNSFRPVFRVE